MSQPQKTELELARDEDNQHLRLAPFLYTPAMTSACRRRLLTGDEANVLCDIVRLTDKETGFCWISNERLAYQHSMSPRTIKRTIRKLIKGGWIRSDTKKERWGTARKMFLVRDMIWGVEVPLPVSKGIRASRRPVESAGDRNDPCTAIDSEMGVESARDRNDPCSQQGTDMAPQQGTDMAPQQGTDMAHKEEIALTKHEIEQTKKVAILDRDLLRDALDFVPEPETSCDLDWIVGYAAGDEVSELDWITNPRQEKATAPLSNNTALFVKKNQDINTPPPSAPKPERKRFNFGTPSPDPKEKPKEETAPPSTITVVDDYDGRDFFDLPPEEQAKWQAQGNTRIAALRLARGLPAQKQDEAAKQAADEDEDEDEDEFSSESIDRDMALAEAAVAADAAANPQPEPDTKPTNKAKTPLRVVDPEADWDVYSETSPEKQEPEEKQESRQARAAAALRKKDGK